MFIKEEHEKDIMKVRLTVQLTLNKGWIKLPITGFELGSFGVGSNCYANCATIADHIISIFRYQTR